MCRDSPQASKREMTMNLTFYTSPAKVTKPGFVRSILELLGVISFASARYPEFLCLGSLP